MASELKFHQGTVNGIAGLVADQRTYATKDGRIVGEGDPEAHELVAAAGLVVDPHLVTRLRLSEKGQAAVKEGEPEAVHSTAVADDKPGEVVRPFDISAHKQEGRKEVAEPQYEPKPAGKGK